MFQWLITQECLSSFEIAQLQIKQDASKLQTMLSAWRNDPHNKQEPLQSSLERFKPAAG